MERLIRGMVTVIVVVLSAAALLSTAVVATAHADAVADCAKIEGKALGGLLDAVIKEGTRACVAGAGGAPQLVSTKTVGAFMGKFYTGIGTGIDKFGAGVCAIGFLQVSVDNILSSTQNFSEQACLVP